MRNCCHFLVAVMLVAGASLVACSDDESSSSSPLQPSPLAPAPAGAGPGGPSASPVSLTAGDVPGISRVAPAPAGFNAYDARIEYRDGEVTITFDPVDMPKMPDAAREYRNRAVTVWHCPVEPHHVSQTCGEPVFWDSFAFSGSPSRTFALADCAGWLVVEAAELSADRYGGWRNAPLSCRTDEEGRTVADVDTGGGGDGWEDSRHGPPVRSGGGPPAPPVITNPGDRSPMQGDAVTFPVAVTSGDVTVSGLPPGLTWSPETGMVSGTVSLGAEVRAYPVTVTADDGVNDAVTETFTIMVMYHTRFLYDVNGPYTFLRVSGTTVNRIHIAFLMLNRAVCPTNGFNVGFNGVVRLRGSGTTIASFQWNNIGAAPWMRGSSYARIIDPDAAGASLSAYRFRGGPARIASEVFPSMAFDLISPVKDPQGLAPPTKTRDAVPPHAPAASGMTYYVTDSVDVTLTIAPPSLTPAPINQGITVPTDGSYCLVEMATCSAAGTVFCA